MEERKIDWSKYRRTVENDEIDRQQKIPPSKKEPTFFQRKQEQEGRSNWSGGVFGGRVNHSR
jgi:hypothetical protein